MKKFLYSQLMLLAVLAMSITFVSCNDDDDDNDNKRGNDISFLVGTWSGTVYDSGYSAQVTYVFDEDNSGTYTIFNNAQDFTYAYTSYSSEVGLLKLSFNDGEYVEYDVYVYDDSRISFSISGESVVLTKDGSSNNEGGNVDNGSGTDDNEDDVEEEKETYKRASSVTVSYTHSCGNRFHATTLDVEALGVSVYIYKKGSSYYWYDYEKNKHYVSPGTYEKQLYRTIETSGCTAKIYVSFTFSAF